MKNLFVLLIFLTAFSSFGQKSGEISFDFNINTYGKLRGVDLFPNPVKNNLTIEFDDIQNCSIYLFDLQGKRIFKQRIEDEMDATYDLSNLESGTYLLFIVDEKKHLATNFRLQKL
jgi:hypothetical protein